MAPPQRLADRRDHGSTRLRPCPAAATAARKMVREICSGCGLPAGLVEDAALVTGVLVTCSARQAHTAIPTRSLDGGIRSVFTAASAALRNVAAPAGGTVCRSAPDGARKAVPAASTSSCPESRTAVAEWSPSSS